MPDVDLRQLERAAAQGDAGAGERLLRERLRRHMIDAERVSLAAWLGDPAALAVLPEAERSEAVGLLELLDHLAAWGRAVAVRGAAALARSLAPPAAEGERPSVDLVVVDPRHDQRRLEPGVPVVVGRGSGADLQIAEERVSRRHCEVTLTPEGHVLVRDLGSKNGTWLGIEALGAEPVRVFDGNVLRLSSAAVEIRSRNALGSQSCLDAVLEWLEDPSEEQVAIVDRALDALDAALQSPFDLAVRAAAHTVLSDPPTPGYFLERIAPLPDEEEARRVARRALLPLALSDRPLPQAPDPPGRYARAQRPRDDPRWRAHATILDEELELRALRRLERFPGDRRGPLVARAADGSLEQVVLIDAIDLEPEERERFMRDATVCTQAAHPRLAAFLGCHDLQLAYGHRFLVFRSRHVRGVDLRTWLARLDPTPGQVVGLFRAVCGAAQALGSLLWRLPIDLDAIRIDLEGRAFLTGQVEAYVRGQLTYTGHTTDGGLGRLAHVSPEEATEARSVQALPCAVYRLGSLLFLALTGRPAFVPTSARVLLAILDEPPPAPSSVGARCSPELDAVVLKALAKLPEDRFPDPLAFEAALAETPEARGEISAGEPPLTSSGAET